MVHPSRGGLALEDYPRRWGRDCGVDLVFKHKNGQEWAVQAKCYSPTYEITKPDVDKFLSETNRKGIDHRLLIATTDRLGASQTGNRGSREAGRKVPTDPIR